MKYEVLGRFGVEGNHNESALTGPMQVANTSCGISTGIQASLILEKCLIIEMAERA